MFLSKWRIMAIVLIFLGGIIIVFLYAVTIRPNFVSTEPKNGIFFLLLLTPFIFLKQSENEFLFHKDRIHYVRQAFRSLNLINLFLLTFYLLLVLFIVIKISEGFKGAIVKKF